MKILSPKQWLSARQLTRLSTNALSALTALKRSKPFERQTPPQTRAQSPARDGNFTEHTFSTVAGTRKYKLYAPTAATGTDLPLIVMLHGCKQSPDDFAAGTRMNELAARYGFLVAYPEQPQNANANKCWNWFSPADQQRGIGEPSLIAGITREIMATHPVAVSRVFVAGLSAGGAAASVMGVTYPDLFAGVGIHSGLACGAAHNLTSALAAMRSGGAGVAAERLIPSIVFHGDKDTIVNPDNANRVIAQSQAQRSLKQSVTQGQSPDGTKHTRIVQRDGAGRAVLEQWVLHGAGHAWSGGSSAGSYTSAAGPDASSEMVRFFFQL